MANNPPDTNEPTSLRLQQLLSGTDLGAIQSAVTKEGGRFLRVTGINGFELRDEVTLFTIAEQLLYFIVLTAVDLSQLSSIGAETKKVNYIRQQLRQELARREKVIGDARQLSTLLKNPESSAESSLNIAQIHGITHPEGPDGRAIDFFDNHIFLLPDLAVLEQYVAQCQTKFSLLDLVVDDLVARDGLTIKDLTPGAKSRILCGHLARWMLQIAARDQICKLDKVPNPYLLLAPDLEALSTVLKYRIGGATHGSFFFSMEARDASTTSPGGYNPQTLARVATEILLQDVLSIEVSATELEYLRDMIAQLIINIILVGQGWPSGKVAHGNPSSPFYAIARIGHFAGILPVSSESILSTLGYDPHAVTDLNADDHLWSGGNDLTVIDAQGRKTTYRLPSPEKLALLLTALEQKGGLDTLGLRKTLLSTLKVLRYYDRVIGRLPLQIAEVESRNRQRTNELAEIAGPEQTPQGIIDKKVIPGRLYGLSEDRLEQIINDLKLVIDKAATFERLAQNPNDQDATAEAVEILRSEKTSQMEALARTIVGDVQFINRHSLLRIMYPHELPYLDAEQIPDINVARELLQAARELRGVINMQEVTNNQQKLINQVDALTDYAESTRSNHIREICAQLVAEIQASSSTDDTVLSPSSIYKVYRMIRNNLDTIITNTNRIIRLSERLAELQQEIDSLDAFLPELSPTAIIVSGGREYISTDYMKLLTSLYTLSPGTEGMRESLSQARDLIRRSPTANMMIPTDSELQDFIVNAKRKEQTGGILLRLERLVVVLERNHKGEQYNPLLPDIHSVLGLSVREVLDVIRFRAQLVEAPERMRHAATELARLQASQEETQLARRILHLAHLIVNGEQRAARLSAELAGIPGQLIKNLNSLGMVIPLHSEREP